MSMLRPVFSVAGRNSAKPNQVAARRTGVQLSRTFATQSGDDTEPPTALAKLHLEDGTTLTAKSFGCHTSVEGEVRSLLASQEIVCWVTFCFEEFGLVVCQVNLLPWLHPATC